MKSKVVALLLSDLGVTKSHSRPYVSDDNPFSEAQFKTLKYRPDFPERFGSIQDAKAFCRDFFHWYNNVHYHSGLNWLTPATVHDGRTDRIVPGDGNWLWIVHGNAIPNASSTHAGRSPVRRTRSGSIRLLNRRR